METPPDVRPVESSKGHGAHRAALLGPDTEDSMSRPHFRLALIALGLLGPALTAHATPTQVFSTNFETGLPPEFSAPGSVIEGVQGYAGLGPVGRQFGGNFLHY